MYTPRINNDKAMRYFLHDKWSKEKLKCTYPKNLTFPEFNLWLDKKGLLDTTYDVS